MSATRGFTLVETLIYLGLFGIIMVGVTVTVSGIFESIGRSQTLGVLREEGDFLVGKLGWVLTGASLAGVSVAPPELTVTKYAAPTNPFVFDLAGDKLRLTTGPSGTPVDLNSDAVQVTALVFQELVEPGKPKGIQASFTLSSLTPQGVGLQETFTLTRYLR